MKKQTGNSSLNKIEGVNSDSKTTTANEINYHVFPKKFRRPLSSYIDKRFAIIWLITFIVNFSAALYFANHPITNKLERSEINKIQKQFAQLVLQRDVLETPEEHDYLYVTEKTSRQKETADTEYNVSETVTKNSAVRNANRVSNTSTSIEVRKSKHTSQQRKRRTERNQISNDISSKGLLGLLTADASTAKGEAVTDVLGDVANNRSNLKEVLNNLDGLKKDRSGRKNGTSAARNRTIKGSRASGGGNDVEDLISEREQAASVNFARQEKIVEAKVSDIEVDKNHVTGNRDPDDISAVVNRHNAAIQSCYQRELKRNPDLRGKLVVRFTISPAGKVKEVELISSTINNSRVERCVIGRIRRWDDFGQIDPSLGDATFRQVYTFGY